MVLVGEGWVEFVNVDLARHGVQVEEYHFVIDDSQEELVQLGPRIRFTWG